jgi:hypothetical protein
LQSRILAEVGKEDFLRLVLLEETSKTESSVPRSLVHLLGGKQSAVSIVRRVVRCKARSRHRTVVAGTAMMVRVHSIARWLGQYWIGGDCET